MLQPPNSLPSLAKSGLAIAIAGEIITRNPKQKHVGLIYRDVDSQPWLLHLGWHHNLKHERWDENYQWLEFSHLDDELKDTFADWAVLVANAANESPIPYSIILSKDRNFAETGHYIDRENGTGLTCATFILALFADFGIPLIDELSWPQSRRGDVLWAISILESLEKYVSLPHFLAQYLQVRILRRYRPEEVTVTAALYAGKPLTFDEVEGPARSCLSDVHS